MPVYFFDTSALQHRYFDSQKSRSIRRIISDRRNTCYILDLTIVEIASAMAKKCRSNKLDNKAYDTIILKFWADVSSDGPLHVLNSGQREILRATHLIRYAGVFRRRNISSYDALIAVSCLEFALENRTRVTFCLEDWSLYDIISQIEAFKQVLKFRFIGTNKRMNDRTG